jgi:RimJ/RimL family protein N-acetyltransferase
MRRSPPVKRDRAVSRRAAVSRAASLELDTERLLLRQFREDDLDDWARITSDATVMRYVGGSAFTRDEAWRSLGYALGHWQIRGFGLWAAEEKSSGRLVGRIGLYQPEGWPGLEVGWLVDRARWGEGIASEGGAAALAHAFEALGADRVISVIEPPNAASIRVAEKLGERFCERRQLQGRLVSIYATSRAQWQARAHSSA